jgi:hypothetical protein
MWQKIFISTKGIFYPFRSLTKHCSNLIWALVDVDVEGNRWRILDTRFEMSTADFVCHSIVLFKKAVVHNTLSREPSSR